MGDGKPVSPADDVKEWMIDGKPVSPADDVMEWMIDGKPVRPSDDVKERIIGGMPVRPPKYGYLVNTGKCTATLIEQNMLLSAAQCNDIDLIYISYYNVNYHWIHWLSESDSKPGVHFELITA